MPELILLRTVIELALVGVVGWLGYRGYRRWRQNRLPPPTDKELIEWLDEHEHLPHGHQQP